MRARFATADTLPQIRSVRASITKMWFIYIFRWRFFCILGRQGLVWNFGLLGFFVVAVFKANEMHKKLSYLNHFSGTRRDQLLNLAADSLCFFLKHFACLEVQVKDSTFTCPSTLWRLQFTYLDPSADIAACYWRRFLLTACGTVLTVPGTLF